MFNPVIGVFSLCLYVLNTLFWCIPIFIGSVLKLLPIPVWRKGLSRLLDSFATGWISVNNFTQRVTSNTRWKVKGTDRLTPNDKYLVIANHQSWVDILVLQRIFNRKIPFLKFFLKKELIWVPVLGLAWWALDFPFMRRYKKSFLEKHPHLKGKDLETTRKACEKFRHMPVSIMNFVEGTRWTVQKHAKQAPVFKHLLKPRAGGVAFVLSSMGDQLHRLLDVTISYPQGVPNFWDFACGKVREIKIEVQERHIDKSMIGQYFEDALHREAFQQWLNQLWLEKDNKLQQLNQK